MGTIAEQTSIGVRGTVKKIAKAPNGAEVIPIRDQDTQPGEEEAALQRLRGRAPLDRQAPRHQGRRPQEGQGAGDLQDPERPPAEPQGVLQGEGVLRGQDAEADLDGDGGRGVPLLGAVLQPAVLPDPEPAALQGGAGHAVREGLRDRAGVPGRGVADPEAPERDNLDRHRGGLRGLSRHNGDPRGADPQGRRGRRRVVREGVREAQEGTGRGPEQIRASDLRPT